MFDRKTSLKKVSDESKEPVSYPVMAPASSSSSSHEESKGDIIDLKDEGFISIANYAHVNDDTEQATKDWIRNQDRIFLNGFSLRFIVDNLKKEYLKKLLSDFLYADMSSRHIADRIAALRELTTALLGNVAGISHLSPSEECTLPDSFLVALHNQLIPIVYNLDYKNEKNKPIYSLSDNESMRLLKEQIKLAGTYFSTERVQESTHLLKKVWDEYLFVSLAPHIDREKYHTIFFQLGHQGGFLFPLFAAHLQHLDASKYVIKGDECIDLAKIQFSADANTVHIIEHTPIIRILGDDAETIYAENPDKSNVMDTEVRHSISLDSKGCPKLHITLVKDVSHNELAREALVGEWFKKKEEKLLAYADYYIQHGHNPEMIMAILNEFSHIKELITVKHIGFLKRHFLSKQNMHHEGDKILLYIGNRYPQYAENILSNVKEYVDHGEDCFVRVIKLLRRMNRVDIANIILMPVLSKQGFVEDIDKLVKIVESEGSIRKVYRLMIKKGFLSQPKVDKPVAEVESAPAITPKKN